MTYSMFLFILTITAMIARVVIDISSLIKPSWQYDVGYAVLFGMVSIAWLLSAEWSIVAWGCLSLAIFYAGKVTIYLWKRR